MKIKAIPLMFMEQAELADTCVTQARQLEEKDRSIETLLAALKATTEQRNAIGKDIELLLAMLPDKKLALSFLRTSHSVGSLEETA